MPSRYVRQLFTGGINQDMDPAMLDLSMGGDLTLQTITSASGLVFERGLIATKLGEVDYTGGNYMSAGSQVVAVRGLPTIYNLGGSGNKGVLALVSNSGTYYLYYFSTLTTGLPYLGGDIFIPQALSGPGISGLDPYNYFSVAVVNGVVLIAGSSGGLYRWDPTTTTYTQIAAAPWRYVAKQYGRAIGAFNLNGPNTAGPTQIAASGTSETDWNFAAGTAYTTYLSDVSDVITGLAVLKGSVLVARTFGFHIGVPTGTFPYIYTWNLHSENAIGLAHPASLDVYKNVAFFASEVGIHMFDLVDITDIGEGIYNEIFTLLQSTGGTLRGFVSASYKADFQPTYNLFIDTTRQGTPHYMYNIREKKWSRHFYKASGQGGSSPIGFASHIAVTGQFSIPLLGVFDRHTTPAVPMAWGVAQPWSPAGGYTIPQFSTGQITVSSPTLDSMLKRLMIVFKASFAAQPTNPTITFSIYSVVDGQPQQISVNLPLNSTDYSVGTVGTTWIRRWVSTRAVGQFFRVYAALGAIATYGGVDYNMQFECKEMLLEFTDEGMQRE